jgi:ElaB/YqjD/DUF883 family membrane-anchored ribosome-binding protein
MEVYFKDLISAESSLEKLVDDVALVVQGVDDFARAVGKNLPDQDRAQILNRLDRLKQSCARLKEQIIGGARATDQMVRSHPYRAMSMAFAIGCLVGVILPRHLARNREDE